MNSERLEISWSQRPFEQRALFNPAFCGELIARTISEYERMTGVALPLPLAFLVLPLILPSDIRAALPGRADRTLATWAAENPAIVSALPHRILTFRPITREALLLLTISNAVELVEASLKPGGSPLRLSGRLEVTTDDTEHLRRAAAMVGRWFASQGTSATILQTMGVRP